MKTSQSIGKTKKFPLVQSDSCRTAKTGTHLVLPIITLLRVMCVFIQFLLSIVNLLWNKMCWNDAIQSVCKSAVS